MALVVANDEADYAIKPEALTPSVDTSQWPLLLKNYDKREDSPNPSHQRIFYYVAAKI